MHDNGEAEDANLQQAADVAAAELPDQVAAAVVAIRAQAAQALGGASPAPPELPGTTSGDPPS